METDFVSLVQVGLNLDGPELRELERIFSWIPLFQSFNLLIEDYLKIEGPIVCPIMVIYYGILMSSIMELQF